MRITPQQAIARLQPQGKRKAKGGKDTPIEYVRPIGETGSLYLFRQGDDVLITTSDSDLKTVVGSCKRCDELPSAMEAWLDEYAAEVEWWQRVGNELEDAGLANNTKRETTPMLVDATWGQGSPYNQNLTFDGKASLSGCAAVAIAQLVYYWGTRGYHRGCTATKEYKTKTNLYSVAALPPLTVFDYVHFTPKKPTLKTAKDAVADLMERVGKALQSDYTPGGTSVTTDKLVPVLRDNLRMGKGVKMVYSAYTTAEGFENAVYDEITAHRPVILFGTGNNGGHFFVCDGYDAANDLYHMNWGWNGDGNGYFALSALNPGTKAYNTRKRAYIGINPDYKLGDVNGDGEIDVSDVMQVAQNVTSGKYDEKSDINSDGQVTVTDVITVVDHVLGKKEL